MHKKRKSLVSNWIVPMPILVVVFASLSLIGLGTVAMAESAFTLTLVHNSDGESALQANDYSGSVAQFATVVQRIRREVGADNTLVVSSGDNFLAGLVYAASEGVYDARALNLSGVEVSAIGNHEFDFGPEGLKRFIEASEFIFVSSNLRFDNEESLSGFVGNKILPYVIVEKGGNQIGLIGATTEQISYISSPGDVIIDDVERSLRRAADKLTAQGVGVIIALTHLQNVDEEKRLASRIDGVDIFVAGGGDNLLGNPNNRYLVRKNRDGEDVVDSPEEPYPFETTSPSGERVVVVSTDGSYNYVGRLTVSFDEEGLIDRIDRTRSGPQPVTPDLPANPTIQTQIVNRVEENIAHFRTQGIGRTTRGLDGTRALVRTQETTMGNAITDGYLYVTRNTTDSPVHFAFTNGGGIRQSLVIGQKEEVTMYHVLTALPFSNYLTVVEGLSPQDVKEIFEHSLSRLPEAGGQFLQVSGITVEYDSSKPVGERVIKIAIGGERLYDHGAFRSRKRYNAVTNSFLADGGDGYGVLASMNRESKTNIGISYAQGFEMYLREQSPIDSETTNRLRDVAR